MILVTCIMNDYCKEFSEYLSSHIDTKEIEKIVLSCDENL